MHTVVQYVVPVPRYTTVRCPQDNLSLCHSHSVGNNATILLTVVPRELVPSWNTLALSLEGTANGKVPQGRGVPKGSS